MIYNIDGKLINLEKCEKCEALKVVGKQCACEKNEVIMKSTDTILNSKGEK